MDNIGGAEMVSLTLARELSADIYTTSVDREKIIKMGFADVLARIFSIGPVPINAPFRQQIALWRFRRLNLKNRYSFYIIAGDWAMSGAVKNKPNLWYVHSPIREIWDLHQYVRQHSVVYWQRPVFDLWVLLNRHLNRKYIRHVQKIVCNSLNTQSRVQKFLGRQAVVIPPPIETADFYCDKPRGYWLSVNRLIKHKCVDMQLAAFSQMPDQKLIVVGSYEKSRHFLEYARHCQRIKPGNVEIRSWVTKDELVKLYAGCTGFITTSKEEDFGMNAVEAMAAGKPVIAPMEGGYRETVIDGVTGILLPEMNERTLREAVVSLDAEIRRGRVFEEACRQRAAFFDTRAFIEKIIEQTESTREKNLQHS